MILLEKLDEDIFKIYSVDLNNLKAVPYNEYHISEVHMFSEETLYTHGRDLFLLGINDSEIWDEPYYNHVKDKFLTYEMFKLLY